MKVIHNCSLYPFHIEYCNNIHEELLDRGHESIIVAGGDGSNEYFDADFTILPDENSNNLGGKGVWIGHALPVIPQNNFYLENSFYDSLHRNSDYIFTHSEIWKEWCDGLYDLPIYNVGFPRLDKLFGTILGGNIVYLPTHDHKGSVYSGNRVKVETLDDLAIKYDCDGVIVRGHPAFYNNEFKLDDCFRNASIVISDYSSTGLEAIVLNIPTILVGDGAGKWKDVINDHISGKADEAAIRVWSHKELETAIGVYITNPKHLEEERLRYSKLLCDYQGISSKKVVDTLEKIKSGLK